MRFLAAGLFGSLLLAAPVSGQVVSPLPDQVFPYWVGQAGFRVFSPGGIGAIPPPYDVPELFPGNPDFMIDPTPEPIHPGSPVAVLFVLSAAPPLVPVQPPVLPYCDFGGSMLFLPFAPSLPVFAGVTGVDGKVPPIPMPLPALPAGLPGIVVLTVGVVEPPSGAPCIFASNGFRLGT